jgi:hypothetical protein
MAPTSRGVFHLVEGLHRMWVTVQGQGPELIEGLNDGQMKILRFFGEQVCCLSQISPGQGAQCRLYMRYMRKMAKVAVCP